MADKKMLELRKRIKSRKPAMIRQDWYKKTRLAKVWRRPKGLHSKFRHGRREREGAVEPGWGSPVQAKGLHKSGLKFAIICSLAGLEKIDSSKQGILISGKVGDRKKMQMVKLALQKKITILNMKTPAEWVAGKELELEQRKKEKAGKAKVEEKKPEEAKPAKVEDKKVLKTEEKKHDAKSAPATEDAKKEADKREKDKLLIKRTV